MRQAGVFAAQMEHDHGPAIGEIERLVKNESKSRRKFEAGLERIREQPIPRTSHFILVAIHSRSN